MAKYLYGASIQGIQEFIFATNKLQEIVGASEIVKSISSNEFSRGKVKEKNPISFEDNFKADKILLNAAGNIKVIFENEDSCKEAVENFPKMVMQNAYGITISQAVVKMEEEFKEQKDAIKELEKRLKAQRNKPSLPLDLSINIMELAPSTARPIVEYRNIKNVQTPMDRASQQKREAFPQTGDYNELADLSNSKNKIAVIHADGNGLGEIVAKLGNKLSSFSLKLDNATQKAFQDAKTDTMEIREVILGGDDLTVICNANKALEFTRKFLDNFEKETSKIEELKGLREKLTACAGIAYCNEKYPFHYAVSLAETLCSQTKKHAKEIDKDLAPSSLMFHNIQSSNYQSWEKFVRDELTIINDVNKEDNPIRLDFGPYYLHEDIKLKKEIQPTIQDLLNTSFAYRQEGSPISRLREWMSELHKSSDSAANLLKRINEITERSGRWKCNIMDKNLGRLQPKLCNQELVIKKDGYLKTPIYDILQIHSVTEEKQ